MCVLVYVCVNLCVCEHVCVHVCVCECEFVYACVHVSNSTKSHSFHAANFSSLSYVPTKKQQAADSYLSPQ